MALLNDYFENNDFWLGKAPTHLQYMFNVGLGLSQSLNVVLGGDVDESVSSRMGRCQLDPKAPWFTKKAAWFIDYVFGKDHCLNAVERNLSRQKEIWHLSSTTDYPKPADPYIHFPENRTE